MWNVNVFQRWKIYEILYGKVWTKVHLSIIEIKDLILYFDFLQEYQGYFGVLSYTLHQMSI